MRILNLENERLPLDYYVPTRRVTVAGNSTEQVTLRGLDSQRFGVTRIAASGGPYSGGLSTLYEFEITARIVQTRETWFEQVNGQALTTLFKDYVMDVPIVIEQGQEVEFTLQNTGSSARTVVIALQGLTAPQLDVREQTLRDQLGMMPEKRFIYTQTKSILAQSDYVPADIRKDPVPQVFSRMGFGTTGALSESRLRLSDRTTTRFQDVDFDALAFINDSPEPVFMLEVAPYEPLTADFSNEASTNENMGIIADTLPTELFRL
jgi:hypothetical protein